MENNKIKFAIIGLGNIGMRHAEHILKNSNALLVDVCDNSSKFQDISIRMQDAIHKIKDVINDGKIEIQNKQINFYNSIEELLKHTTADVINVCTPNYLHATHTIAALNAGKHVVCEKPMSTSLVDAEAMIAASQKNNKTIFVVKQNRYNPPVQQVKKLIQRTHSAKLICLYYSSFHYYPY